MDAVGPSMLSLVAAAIYAGAILLCLTAAFVAALKRQVSGHIVRWGALAAFFGVLVFLRVTNLEEIWRDELRTMLRTGGYYGERRAIQAPVAAGLLIVFALAAQFWIARMYRVVKGRRNVAVALAQLGAFVMLGMIALRMVSYSLIDRLLYGPLKLNWIGDLAATALVAGCALYYIVVVMAPPRQRKPGKPV
ncbi:MAG: hypothetical protein ACXIUO_09345 [Erythrobacter sp.]